MKIIYYSPHPNLNLTDPAGYGTHMREMIAAFRALGHSVEPLIMGGTQPRPSTAPPKNPLWKRTLKKVISKRRWQTMKDDRLMAFDEEAQQQLERLIDEVQPDLIYERGNYMQVSGVRAAKKHGVMHVMEMNSPYTQEKIELEGESSRIPEANRREAEQLEKSDHIVCVSSSLRDHLLEKHRVRDGKFSVLPNAIDPEKVEVKEEETATIRARYGLAGKTVIGWVGSIQPWHGIDTLIHAFAALAANHPDAMLMLVGSGETIEAMRALANSTGLGDRIVFTDYVPHREVFAHIAAMDITVLANTKWYCSPIKIFEYGVMNKAVIATNHAAVLDVMLPDVDGLIIDVGRDKLEQAMRQLLADPALRARLAASFHAKILQRHTWQANARAVLDIADFSSQTIART